MTGHVQGVFYRSSCRTEALRRGVAGWVTNRSDGAVEAVFEGDEAAVDAMIEWARLGPADAEVDRITVTDEPPEGRAGFSVR
jgi:acylphosphatase